MPARSLRFAIAILAAAAWGQTTSGESVSQDFAFIYAQGPVAMQEITNAVRSAGEITQAAYDAAGKTLTVTGTPAQLAMATWMINTLDQPAPANQATQEFIPAGSTNDVLRVMYLTHPGSMSSFQEIVNAVRTIPEITRVFPYTGQYAIVMRGTNSQVAMGEWLFHQLDLAAGLQPPQSPSAHQYMSPGATNDIAQVVFLAHPWTLQSMQQIVNTVRTIPQLTKVFSCTASGAVALRGPTASVALGAWLFGQLDQAPPTSALAPQQFQMPNGADDVTQIFYLGPAATPQSLQSIVNAIRSAGNPHVFPDSLLNAVTLRGSAAQIAAADSLIKQMNQP